MSDAMGQRGRRQRITWRTVNRVVFLAHWAAFMLVNVGGPGIPALVVVWLPILLVHFVWAFRDARPSPARPALAGGAKRKRLARLGDDGELEVDDALLTLEDGRATSRQRAQD